MTAIRPRGRRAGAPVPPRSGAAELLADPFPYRPAWPEPEEVRTAVDDLMAALVRAVDAGNPDVLDGLISNWADQWESLADREHQRELAHWDAQSARAAGEVGWSAWELGGLRARRERLGRLLGRPVEEALPPTGTAVPTPPATDQPATDLPATDLPATDQEDDR